MTDTRLAPWGATLLRLALGIMFLAHSVILKLGVFTLVGTAAYFESLGLPAFTAYLVFAAEAVGGLLLVLGVQVRWVSLALIPVLAGALWVHSGNGWVFSGEGGGWEYPLLLIVLSVVQAMIGDGALALSRSIDPRRLFGATAAAAH